MVTSLGGANITDIAVLSPSRLLVADYTKSTLKLLDSVNGRVLSKATLPAKPRRLCLLSDGCVAVTMYRSRKIQFICVANDAISLDKSIDVKNDVAGIATIDSHLLLGCDSPGKVEMMTMDGRVVNEVDNQKAGKQVFSCPCFIATTSSGEIFVSDYGTDMIIQMDRSLCITQTFTNPMLTSPYGIASVSTDQLLVADKESHIIVVLNTTSGTVTPLLGREDGIQHPWAVVWHPVSKRLYVCRTGYQPALNVFFQK